MWMGNDDAITHLDCCFALLRTRRKKQRHYSRVRRCCRRRQEAAAESTDQSASLSHLRLAAAHHFSALCRPSRSDHKPVRDLYAAGRLPVSERLKRLLQFLPDTCCATGLLSAFFTEWSLSSSLQGAGLSIVPLSSCMLVCRSGKARGCTPCVCV